MTFFSRSGSPCTYSLWLIQDPFQICDNIGAIEIKTEFRGIDSPYVSTLRGPGLTRAIPSFSEEAAVSAHRALLDELSLASVRLLLDLPDHDRAASAAE